MNATEREQLAKRLSALTWKEARKEVFRLDPDANLKFFRNSIWDEYHTLYLLPNLGVQITLVDKQEKDTMEKDDPASMLGRVLGRRHKKAIDFNYVGARVEELQRPVANASGRGRDPRAPRAKVS